MNRIHLPGSCLASALMAVLALSSAPPVLAQQQPTATVEGRVLNQEGQPVSGARVRLVGGARAPGALTNSAGRFVLPGLASGSHTLRVEGLGYQPAEQRVELSPGEREGVELALRTAPIQLEAIDVVGVTRSSTRIAAIPGAVTVVGREEVEEGAAITQSVGDILGKAVPGLAVGTQSMSNFGQSLRGRTVAVLIDGVPQSTLRNVSRDFVNLDPAMIERVEVLRGATALFGDGATGGVINIITRSPGVGPVRMNSELSMSGSLSNPGEGVGGRLTQGISGKRGALDYVASATLARTGSYYDGEGDRIPADPHGQGGLADTDSHDLFGKLGYAFGEQRVQATANLFRSSQDTEFTADPSVNQLPRGEQKARALPGLRESKPQGTHNLLLSLDYSHADVLGGSLRSQLYYRDYLTRFRGFDRRRFNRTTGEWVSGQVGQSFVVSEKLGGRLEAESFLFGAGGPSLVWGADYTFENTSQLMGIMDPEAYDASNGLVFRQTGERTWVPPLRPHNLGLFAQVGWNVTDDLLVRGGARHERIRMRVEDFVTIDDNQVFGGDLAYDPTLFNLGVVVGASRPVNAFASFSQGFSLADIGRILRAAPEGFDLGTQKLEAPEVNHYEVGLRQGSGLVQSSLSIFLSRSQLGTRLVENEIGMLEVARAPERIYGIEATADLRPSESLGLGGTVSWTEGEFRDAAADRWRAFDGYRIQPVKLTGYVESETLPGWNNRLQVLHSGSRDRAFEDRRDPSKPAGYGEWPIEAYTVVDLHSSLELGVGTLSLGVENLLNRQYFDIVSQLDLVDGNAYYTAARGATFTLGYSVKY